MLKRLIFAICLISTVCVSSSVIASPLDDGFRGVPWMTPESELPKLGLEAVAPGLMYIKGNENNTFGLVPLIQVMYIVIDNKFRGALMCADMKYFRNLVDETRKMLGKETMSNSQEFTWNLEKIKVIVALSMEDNDSRITIARKSDTKKENRAGGF